MKLMLLIIPTNHRTVNPTATGPSNGMTRGPNGFCDEVDGDPAEDRDAGQPDLAEELPAGPQVEVVVDDAERGGQDAAERAARTSSGGPIVVGIGTNPADAVHQRGAPSVTITNDAATATPPPRGTGRGSPAAGPGGPRRRAGSRSAGSAA